MDGRKTQKAEKSLLFKDFKPRLANFGPEDRVKAGEKRLGG
jgi:hypothetical protein